MGLARAQVIPSMYNVCGMMRENSWNDCRYWSYYQLGSCSHWTVWRLNEAPHSLFREKDFIHPKCIQNCKVKHFKPYDILSWLLIYQPAQKFTEWIIKKCSLHGVRKDRQEEIWNMPHVCSLITLMCRQSEKLSMVTCLRELFQTNANKKVSQETFFGKKKNQKERKERKDSFSVNLRIYC